MGRGTLRTLAAIGIAIAVVARDIIASAKDNIDLSTGDGILSLAITSVLAYAVNWLVSKAPAKTDNTHDSTGFSSTERPTGRMP